MEKATEYKYIVRDKEILGGEPVITNKTISKSTYFYTLPSIPSHQGRGNLLPLPWWERARVRGCGFTYELLSIIATRRNVYELAKRVSRVLSGYTKESIKNQMLYV
jgi:hypothetical protein